MKAKSCFCKESNAWQKANGRRKRDDLCPGWCHCLSHDLSAKSLTGIEYLVRVAQALCIFVRSQTCPLPGNKCEERHHLSLWDSGWNVGFAPNKLYFSSSQTTKGGQLWSSTLTSLLDRFGTHLVCRKLVKCKCKVKLRIIDPDRPLNTVVISSNRAFQWCSRAYLGQDLKIFTNFT